MERLLAVRCPGLIEEDESGGVLRAFDRVVAAVEASCPWVTVVRTGICTLPIRGPARYFGGEHAVVDLVTAAAVEAVEAAAEAVEGGSSVEAVEVGIAEGTFAAVLAARTGTIVEPGGTTAFLAPFPLAVLGERDLVDVLARLGITTLGAFAALPERHVLGRFGATGVACHAVASGRSGNLPGLADPGAGRRLHALRHPPPPPDRQPGFWGGASEADARAAQVLTRVQGLLGPDGVLTARLQGGRSPAERARDIPWSAQSRAGRSSGAGRSSAARRPGGTGSQPPWPGAIPLPAPLLVHRDRPAAELVGPDGTAVAVSGRGVLSGEPARLSVAGGPWERIAAWAGPWPTEERWWTRGHRRTARLQVVTAGTARLLVVERGSWQVEATYG